MMPFSYRSPKTEVPVNVAGGSASPKTMLKAIAEGADIRRESRLFRQRVEDNAFHPRYLAR
jgi:hypothetical protein